MYIENLVQRLLLLSLNNYFLINKDFHLLSSTALAYTTAFTSRDNSLNGCYSYKAFISKVEMCGKT